MCGASLTLVPSIADFCRYTPTRRDMRIGLFASATTAVLVTTFVGGYAGAATGELNPFVAVADLTSVDAVLVILLVAIVVQGIAANITNVYTAGLSLLNAVPSLGRFRSTLVAAVAAIGLCAFPELHRGGADLDQPPRQPRRAARRRRARRLRRAQALAPGPGALFDPHGPYRYLDGVNVAAVVAIAVGAGAYYAVPQAWLKVVWGIAVGAAAYAVLRRAAAALGAYAPTGIRTSSQRSSSPS